MLKNRKLDHNKIAGYSAAGFIQNSKIRFIRILRIASMSVFVFFLLAKHTCAYDLAYAQECLTFLLYYQGLADGQGGALTGNAIRDFQRSIGVKETGDLLPAEFAALSSLCKETKEKIGWAPFYFDKARVTIDLPLKIIQRVPRDDSFVQFSGLDEGLVISLFGSVYGDAEKLDYFYNTINSSKIYDITYHVRRKAWFVLSGHNTERHIYAYGRLDGQRIFSYIVE